METCLTALLPDFLPKSNAYTHFVSRGRGVATKHTLNTPGISEKCHFHENMIAGPGQSSRKTRDRQAREVWCAVLRVLEQRGDGNVSSELSLSFPLSLGVGPVQRIG